MEVSRLDSGQEEVREEDVDLGGLVEATLRIRGWADHVALTSDGVTVASDRRRLERIVANLVGNAVEHGGRDVTVWVGRDDAGAFVEVSDRGAGIAPQDLPHVFDRFYKADRARTGGGTGLGLAIARDQARLLGGDIEAWSEPRRGTRFTLRLPVTEPLPDGDEGVAPGSEDEAAPTRGEVQP